jgi:hypothetical protein
MKVFLSWSGEKSRVVAEALRDWLPKVVQEVKPFMSAEDIAAGTRWEQRIAHELKDTGFGVLCVTRENQSAPWLNFEAGAIAKQVDSSRVVPLAVDLTVADLKPPLGHFQAKEMSQSGIFDVLQSINELADAPRPDLPELLNVWWPHLKPKLEAASSASASEPVRSERELLEELVAMVRGMQPPKNPSFYDLEAAEFLLADLRDLVPASHRVRLRVERGGRGPLCIVSSADAIPMDTRKAMIAMARREGYGLLFAVPTEDDPDAQEAE